VKSVKPDQAEDVIVRNLIEALNGLQHDLDRIELWTAALHCFRHPAPTIICCRRAEARRADRDFPPQRFLPF
jgi:hypothetical protein